MNLNPFKHFHPFDKFICLKRLVQPTSTTGSGALDVPPCRLGENQSSFTLSGVLSGNGSLSLPEAEPEKAPEVIQEEPWIFGIFGRLLRLWKG